MLRNFLRCSLKQVVYLFCLLFQITIFADFPKNNLDKEDFLYQFSPSMTEKEFRAVINKVANIYRPVIQSFGANLEIDYLWTDSTVNASAEKIDETTWVISMFGGLARRPEITADGFSLVVCHEIGHLIGGFPFYTGYDVATEGQADYWATQACARALWFNQNPGARKARTLAAAQSISNLLATINNEPNPLPNLKDPTKVFQTLETHPNAQCRLDTYLAGNACNVVFNRYSYPRTQYQAFNTSCAMGIGARPSCWFAQQ